MLSVPTAACTISLIPFCIPCRYKKYYRNWKIPNSFRDFQNLSQSKPNPYDEWDVEWKNSSLPRELQAFDVYRLPSYLRARSNPSSEFFAVKSRRECTPDYRRRLFGLYGLKSGVDPAWIFTESEAAIPSDVAKDRFEEKSLLEILEQKKLQEKSERLENEALMLKIKENLKKMPQLIDRFISQQSSHLKAKDVKDEKLKLVMEEARDRYGFYPDKHDDKIKSLMAEFEEREKLERKEKKKAKKKAPS